MTKQYGYPIVWSLIYLLLLLSSLTPLLIITGSLLMIPVVVLFVKLNIKQFSFFYIIILALLYVLLGMFSLFPVLLSAYLLLPALVMGHFYKKQISARGVITAGVIALVASALLLLLISDVFGHNIIQMFSQYIHTNAKEIIKQMPSSLNTMLNMDQMDMVLKYLIEEIPALLLLSSVFFVIVTHWLSRYFLNKSGESIPGLKPFRDWKLPRSFAFYFVLALITDLFVTDNNSMISVVVLNLIPILVIAFAIQGLSFLFYMAHEKKWNLALPILGIIVFIFPGGKYILSFLGVFDILMPLRERLKK